MVVSNAGISVSAPIEATTLDDWQRMNAVMNAGYFLVGREAFRLWKRQGRGGTLIFVASKNSVYAGKNAAAYSAVKAAELHLARCLAEEGGAFGIRINSVMPDAVLQGSGIWDQGWREQRARNYGIAPDELDEFCSTASAPPSRSASTRRTSPKRSRFWPGRVPAAPPAEC